MEHIESTADDSTAPGSRQAYRSGRTRSALLTAAQTVFARDGFEAARIEDIATEAGRSRGAFYANFQSKTELLLELRNSAMRHRARELRARIESVTGDVARRAAVTRYLIEQICDRETLLLQIEFKLFALRHPDLLPDLAQKHLETSTSINLEELYDLLPHADGGLVEVRRVTLAIEALLEGFALNALFGPTVLDTEYLSALVPTLLEAILPRKRDDSTVHLMGVD
jgi:AcrR family transcriptional regulator